MHQHGWILVSALIQSGQVNLEYRYLYDNVNQLPLSGQSGDSLSGPYSVNPLGTTAVHSNDGTA